MDIVQIFSFMLIAALLVISPGPNGVLIAKTVPISGKTAGFANIGGFVAAFAVHGSLSILGISIILVQSAEAFFIFKMLGAAYLVWVGIKTCWDAWKHQIKREAAPLPVKKKASLTAAFFEGFLTNVLNPKVSMFYLAAFPQFMPASGDILFAFVLVSLHAMINVVWFSAMVIFLAKVKNLSSNQSFSRWLKSITGPIFIGFGVKLALLRPLNS